MLLTHLFENKINISEGGNIFKGDLATQRINQSDVAPTVAWLEKHTGLPLQDGMLGTTGRKDTSGDLDLAVDSRSISKDQLVAKLSAVAKSMKLNPADVIKKSGISVHFRTPIAGDPKKGHVQSDFMFTDDPEWTKFSMAASGTSQYRGAHKHIVMSSIAKAMGLKWSATAGLLTRDSGKLLSKDPDEIAEMLLGKGRDRKDLESVETLLDALKNDPERDEKLLDARETLARENVKLPESINEAVPGYDRDHYGNWTVDMSQKPVKMPKVTGDTAMYVAKATHKKIEGLVLYGKGNTQGAARDDAMSQIHDKTRSADPDAFKQFTIDLNVDFTREYLDPKSGNYFKMAKNDAGEPVLVMASRDYFAAFGKDMEQLGFRRGYQRTSAARMGAAATPVYAVPTSKGQVKALGLIPNMRYSLDDVGQDEDGNQMFALKADTRVISPQDRYKMGVPGLTLAATMAEDAPSDQVHGTDKARTVKPRPFAGSQPHPFQGKLVGGESRVNEEGNPTDKITMDIPLFLRMMEYAREDANSDMDLHDVTERAIELMQQHEYLCMDNYEEIVGNTNEAKKKITAKDDPCWSGYHMVGTKTKNGREVPNCVPGKKGD